MWTFDWWYAYYYGVPYFKIHSSAGGTKHFTKEELKFIKQFGFSRYPTEKEFVVICIFKGDESLGLLGHFTDQTFRSKLNNEYPLEKINLFKLVPFDN